MSGVTSEILGKEFVEKSCLLCLKTLFEALTLESFLSDYIRQSGAAMIASSLESLLQTVNPRSGEIDYIVTIAR